MTDTRIYYAVAGVLSWGLLCPAVGAPISDGVTAAAELPAPVAMSRGAGEGMLLFVEVRTEGGKAFRCALDTGSPNTVLPVRLEPALGKRVAVRRFFTLDRPNEVEHVYAAPKLYLGKTRLMTGTQVGTSGTFGILGMDCLRHYRIQLDFEARAVRFLSSDQLKVCELGRAFPLSDVHYARIKHPGFFQSKQAELLIDTGCPFDGYLDGRAFKRALQEQHPQALPFFKDGMVLGTAPGIALFPQCVWDAESYTNLIIGKGFDLVGLRFLGRHLVTFDFPGGMLYLKRTVAERLPKRASGNLESANQVGRADGRQPSAPDRDSTSTAAASRRSPWRSASNHVTIKSDYEISICLD